MSGRLARENDVVLIKNNDSVQGISKPHTMYKMQSTIAMITNMPHFAKYPPPIILLTPLTGFQFPAAPPALSSAKGSDPSPTEL